MGTDIYLEYDKQSKAEKNAQITGYDINEGDKGYIRASIGMVTENGFLRVIFPNEYWEGKKERFIFTEEGYEKLVKLGVAYIIASLTGEEVEFDAVKKQKEFINVISSLMTSSFGEDIQSAFQGSLSFDYAITWLNSVFNFYRLGLRKEKEKLNPKVRISW